MIGRMGRATQSLRPGQTEAPGPERRAAARALFEGQPGATCESVGRDVGVPVGTVRRWKSEDGWKPAVKSLPDLSARAAVLANSFKTKMSELGKPLDDSVAAAETAKEMGVQIAVDVRADLLERHRKEWSAPRNIAYQAIKESTGPNADVGKAFERAKLAKITSETLTLIQAGECRAYGITADAKSGDGSTIVVVDRAAPMIESSPATAEPSGPALDSAETSTNEGEETF